MADRDAKVGLLRKLLAFILSALAARLAIMAVELIWTKGLGRGLPGAGEEQDSLASKAIWVGLTAAAVAVAREVARDLAESSGAQASDDA